MITNFVGGDNYLSILFYIISELIALWYENLTPSSLRFYSCDILVVFDAATKPVARVEMPCLSIERQALVVAAYPYTNRVLGPMN